MIRRQTIINLILCATGCVWGIPALMAGNWFGLIPVVLTVIVVVLSVRNGLFSNDIDDD